MRELVTVYDTVAETVTVYDTIREKTTIQLNAEGDTVRKETEREHVSDRTRERASASQQTATSQWSHEAESSSDERQTVVEQGEGTPWRVLGRGVVAGFLCGITGTLGLLRLIRKTRK